MCVLIAVNNWVIGLTGKCHISDYWDFQPGTGCSVFRPILFSNMTTTIIKNINKNIFNKGILQNNKHQALDHLNIPASQCPLYPMNLRTHLQKNGLIIRFSNKLSYIMLNLN